jgi:hypothetical protein
MTRLRLTIQDHLRDYPNARPSTLAYIAKRHEKFEALRNKPRLKHEPKPNLFIRFLAWMGRK